MSKVTWAKLAQYNSKGDMYLLIALDAMWLNKKLEIEGKSGKWQIRTDPEFIPPKHRQANQGATKAFNGRDIRQDMADVLNDEMVFDDPTQNNGKSGNPNATSFKQKYMGKQGKVILAIQQEKRREKTERISLTDLRKTTEFGGGATTGGSGAGAGKTEKIESSAAWMTALRYTMGSTDFVVVGDNADAAPSIQQLNKVQGRVNTTASKQEVHDFLKENPAWLKTSQQTANLIYNEYEGNKDTYKFYRGKGIVEHVEKAFYRVNASHTDSSGKKMKPFSNLNKWSPADIYLVRQENAVRVGLGKTTTYATLNSYMTEQITGGNLIGVSLKGFDGANGGGKITQWNYGKHSAANSKRTYDKVDTKAGLFGALDVHLFGNNNMDIQFRSTDTKGSTWQGEVLEGTFAKHGKIGGGVFDRFMEEMLGTGLFSHIGYPSIKKVYQESIKENPKGGKLGEEIQEMTSSTGTMKSVPTDDERTERKGGKMVVPLDVIRNAPCYDNKNKQHPPSKWMFSKFLGLKMGEALGKASKIDADKFMTTVFRYATSQSVVKIGGESVPISGPFIKISQ
tara:strand:- start:1911 stop:3608 length:1698 start_codon:yes stop_codon:yes gene_type:complete